MSNTPRIDEFICRAVRTDHNWRTFARQLERELAGLRADNAELIDRLREARESHLHASARDVQTIQQQAVLLAKLRDAAANAGCLGWFLAAYASAKTGSLPDPLAEAVKRMESLDISELSKPYEHAADFHSSDAGLRAVRARLIQAAKGQPAKKPAASLDEPPGPA